ncbi:hypothetical protein [Longimicrobium sp.]|uniref:hypothetical protein n=1 Tax=Longimicrobium sp. TaxID=2029185 RepID=UPI002C659056|nr:hypothetical protein [Longimicrobium sp.]HSU17658.1 hypothetical protein [Longimicrobium sp.]
MTPGHPLLWRDRARTQDTPRASHRAPTLRIVPADGARGGGERELRRRGDAGREREFHPYGLMAWWPQA